MGAGGTPIFIAVTGGRDYSDYAHVKHVLDEEQLFSRSLGSLVIVQGECPYGGADALAALWCERGGVPCIGLKAAWRRLGKSAGPIRNGWMLDLLPIYKLVAFPGGIGTANCIEQAEKREILVRDERGAA
jgi:hypothetical protein